MQLELLDIQIHYLIIPQVLLIIIILAYFQVRIF